MFIFNRLYFFIQPTKSRQYLPLLSKICQFRSMPKCYKAEISPKRTLILDSYCSAMKQCKPSITYLTLIKSRIITMNQYPNGENNKDKNAHGYLHFFCGKMAAGKSTKAKQLADQHQAILLIEDDLLQQLYGDNIQSIDNYIQYSQRLKSTLEPFICQLLMHNLIVILDFPGNTLGQRRWFRTLIEKTQAQHQLHYIEASDALCKQQLRQRNELVNQQVHPSLAQTSTNTNANPPTSNKARALTDEATFDAISQYFTPPTPEEQFNVVCY